MSFGTLKNLKGPVTTGHVSWYIARQSKLNGGGYGMYPWLVFLHLLGVFGFLLAHGASASASFALRAQP